MDSMIQRYNQSHIVRDLDRKMVLLSGPRQAGKTTLAKSLRSVWENLQYLNFDSTADRRIFLKESWSRSCDLVVFDEIHKHRYWKNKIKGVYDTEGPRPRLLVTGSARLALYQKKGDSLVGRYLHHRLYPLSLREVNPAPRESRGTVESMLALGSFPEPFLSQSQTEARRWRRQYLNLVVTQDILQLEDVRNISSLELLVELLRERVGSPISFSSLARDLEVAPNTVRRYVEILERLYVVFRVMPYHRNVARAILKEPKIYFFDVGLVAGDRGPRFENLIALHLLKHLHFLEDTQGAEARLHYLRDKQEREVDFLWTEDVEASRGRADKTMLLEVKTADEPPSRSLRYFAERLGFKAAQVSLDARQQQQFEGISVLPAAEFLSSLAC
ncbi:MAG: ATP-binding protein [Planctomycetes bacterium]|nr:ATP-binding protein [Planctomycetota bacterium]